MNDISAHVRSESSNYGKLQEILRRHFLPHEPPCTSANIQSWRKRPTHNIVIAFKFNIGKLRRTRFTILEIIFEENFQRTEMTRRLLSDAKTGEFAPRQRKLIVRARQIHWILLNLGPHAYRSNATSKRCTKTRIALSATFANSLRRC